MHSMYCEFLLNLSTTSIDLCVDRNLSGDLELDIFDPIFQISFLVSVSIGISIRFLTHRTTAPPQKIMAIFQLGAFLMSMIWLYILCEVIVELLELFGMITLLPSTLLGLTVLTWGNSIGDTIASISISKRGFGEMALTGCIAGPTFNIMLGLGLTTLVCNLKMEGGIKFDIHNSEGMSTFAVLLATLFCHIVLSWIIFANDFKVK